MDTAAVRVDHQLMGRVGTQLTIKQKLPKSRDIADRDLIVINKLSPDLATGILILLFLATEIMDLTDSNHLQMIKVTVG